MAGKKKPPPFSLDPPAPKRLRLPLATVKDVQRELARVYRLFRAEAISESRAKSLAYVLSLLGRLIEGGDLERRIAELEDAGSGGS